MNEYPRLPGEPDDYWQCAECEWTYAVPGGAEEAACPECGGGMIHVSDEPPEGWDRWEATIGAQRTKYQTPEWV